MPPPMHAGRMRDRVQFALPSAATNNRGRAEWDDEGSPVWACVEPLNGTEVYQAAGSQAVATHRVTIRNPGPFEESTACRLRATVTTQGDRKLFVVACGWSDDRMFLVLTCRSDG